VRHFGILLEMACNIPDKKFLNNDFLKTQAIPISQLESVFSHVTLIKENWDRISDLLLTDYFTERIEGTPLESLGE